MEKNLIHQVGGPEFQIPPPLPVRSHFLEFTSFVSSRYRRALANPYDNTVFEDFIPIEGHRFERRAVIVQWGHVEARYATLDLKEKADKHVIEMMATWYEKLVHCDWIYPFLLSGRRGGFGSLHQTTPFSLDIAPLDLSTGQTLEAVYEETTTEANEDQVRKVIGYRVYDYMERQKAMGCLFQFRTREEERELMKELHEPKPLYTEEQMKNVVFRTVYMISFYPTEVFNKAAQHFIEVPGSASHTNFSPLPIHYNKALGLSQNLLVSEGQNAEWIEIIK